MNEGNIVGIYPPYRRNTDPIFADLLFARTDAVPVVGRALVVGETPALLTNAAGVTESLEVGRGASVSHEVDLALVGVGATLPVHAFPAVQAGSVGVEPGAGVALAHASLAELTARAEASRVEGGAFGALGAGVRASTC